MFVLNNYNIIIINEKSNPELIIIIISIISIKHSET